MIAADGRILDNYSLQVNESSLTGESTNVDKSEDAIEEEVALADRINMVYSGTLVAQGRAVVLVTATGMKTEMGKIAELMNATQERNTDTKQNDASVQMKKEIGDPTESCLLIMAQKAGLAKAGIRTVISRLYLSERAFAGKFEIFYESMEHRCFCSGNITTCCSAFSAGIADTF